MIFQDVSTGAQNDLERCTEIAQYRHGLRDGRLGESTFDVVQVVPVPRCGWRGISDVPQ